MQPHVLLLKTIYVLSIHRYDSVKETNIQESNTTKYRTDKRTMCEQKNCIKTDHREMENKHWRQHIITQVPLLTDWF